MPCTRMSSFRVPSCSPLSLCEIFLSSSQGVWGRRRRRCRRRRLFYTSLTDANRTGIHESAGWRYGGDYHRSAIRSHEAMPSALNGSSRLPAWMSSSYPPIRAAFLYYESDVNSACESREQCWLTGIPWLRRFPHPFSRWTRTAFLYIPCRWGRTSIRESTAWMHGAGLPKVRGPSARNRASCLRRRTPWHARVLSSFLSQTASLYLRTHLHIVATVRVPPRETEGPRSGVPVCGPARIRRAGFDTMDDTLPREQPDPRF